MAEIFPDISLTHCLPADWCWGRGGVESGDVMVGGDRPAQPRTTQPPSSHPPALCAHRTNGDLEIFFIAKQKQIYSVHRIIIGLLFCWFAYRGGGGGDRTGFCERKSVDCILINLAEKWDVARSRTNIARISGLLTAGSLREYWGLSECDFKWFLPLRFVFFFRRRGGTLTSHMAGRTFDGDLWIRFTFASTIYLTRKIQLLLPFSL